MSRVVVAKYKILEYPKDVVRKINEVARTCYKSHDMMTKNPKKMNDFVVRMIDAGHHAMVEFGGDIVVRFTSNRGFTHELVRHRMCSFAQESTRYCNYSKDKFENMITVCDPIDVISYKVKDREKHNKVRNKMFDSWLNSEKDYLELLELGVTPDIAREVLPIGVKAEICVKANIREWRHIFSLRCSKKAHPRMRELMRPLLSELKELLPIVFDDL